MEAYPLPMADMTPTVRLECDYGRALAPARRISSSVPELALMGGSGTFNTINLTGTTEASQLVRLARA